MLLKGETTYLLVLLHGESAPDGLKGRKKDAYSAQRFFDAIKLFEYAFAHDTVTLNTDDLIKRCLPETYAVSPDPDRTLATEILYRIEWNRAETLTLPRWQADAFALDPFPEENLVYEIRSYSAPVGTLAGFVSVMMNGEAVFSGDLIADEYTYPPTPEPTAEPIYIITEDTPSPAPDVTAAPASTPEWIPLPSDPTPAPGSWFWNLFRCNPSD